MRPWLAALALGCLAGVASANGRMPSAGQILAHPGPPQRIMLRTTFGILLSSDRGQSWQHVCEKAMHYGGAQDPPYAFTSDGDIALVHTLGFVRGEGDGSSFSPTVRLKSPRDLSIDPHADRTWVLTSRFFAQRDDSTYAYRSWLYSSDASGRDLTAARLSAQPEAAPFELAAADGASAPLRKLALPDDVQFETVDNVPGDATRVVLSGATHAAGNVRGGVLMLSDDGGAGWSRSPVPLEPSEYSLYIAAISLRGAEPWVIARTFTTSAGPGRLLAAPFSALLAAARLGAEAPLRELWRHETPIAGVAVGRAGELYVGGEGVFRSDDWTSDGGATFAQVNPSAVRCLAQIDDELWACTEVSTGSLLRVSRDGGHSFEPRAALTSITAMAKGTEALCQAEWDQFGAEFMGQVAAVDDATLAPAPGARAWWQRWPSVAAVTTALAALVMGAWLRRRSRRSPADR